MENATSLSLETNATTTDTNDSNNNGSLDILNVNYKATVRDIEMYGMLLFIPLGLILNTLSLVVFLKCKDFNTSIGKISYQHLRFLC